MELACLARRAGWQTLLLDRHPQAPARPFSDGFGQLDLYSADALDEACAEVDILIPAIENAAVLDHLVQWDHSGSFNLRRMAPRVKMALVPIRSGLGIISGLTRTVCGILIHLGFDARVTQSA